MSSTIIRSAGFARQLKVQWDVIAALMIREVNVKYGHSNLGFFWIIAEPMILTFLVSVVWSVTSHGSSISTIGVPLFILTGYSGLVLWRHLVGRSISILRLRAELLYHNNIKPIDIIVATYFLEIVSVFTAFSCSYVPLVIVGFLPAPTDPLLLIGGWLMLGLFGMSVGILLAAMSEMTHLLEKFVQPIIYVTLPLTGVFSLIEWMPPRARQVLSYSPVANAIEMFRAGAFPEDAVLHYDPLYVVKVSLILVAIGIPLMVIAQKHVSH